MKPNTTFCKSIFKLEMCKYYNEYKYQHEECTQLNYVNRMEEDRFTRNRRNMKSERTTENCLHNFNFEITHV